MKILLENGTRYLPYQYKDEDELEQMVVEHSEIIFGRDSVLFPKQKIKARSGIATIPDGFVLLIDDKEWYILEVELASHPLYEHIVVQISKFSSAIRNPNERKKLIEAFFHEIRDNVQLKNKFDSKGITTELYKFISDVIDKDPKLIILIDEEREELNEVCKSLLQLQPRVLDFQTYFREGVDIRVQRVHIHLFDALKENGGPISDILYFKAKKTKGTAVYLGPEIRVEKGAIGGPPKPSLKKSANLFRIYKEMERAGVIEHLEDKPGYWRLLKPYVFSSPSAAASILKGSPQNGMICWMNEQGIPLRDLLKQKMKA